MISAVRKFGFARLAAALIFGSVLFACVLSSYKTLSPQRYDFQNGIDLAGSWDFQNGELESQAATNHSFSARVIVPEQLPEIIRKNLKSEFWYRKVFTIPPALQKQELALSLGSVKGKHEVYLNGKFIGAGGSTGLGVYRIPSHLIQYDAVLTVRVVKSDTLYPGIVHFNPVGLGPSEHFADHIDKYYFEIGLRPLIPAAFKFFLAFIFVSFFLISAAKREYLSFSTFLLFSAFSGALYSRFNPFYQEFYFRSALYFLASTLSLATVPWLAADFCRLTDRWRSFFRGTGLSLALIFILGACLANTKEARLSVYQLSLQWLPILGVLPSAFLCAWRSFTLDHRLLHRRIELGLFAVFLFLGAVTWNGSSSAVFSFQKFFHPEFVDLILVAGMGVVMLFNWRAISKRSDRIGQAAPKWFSYFLASGLTEANIEIPLVALAVDTVGYTKLLGSVGENRKDSLHAEIRLLLSPLIEKFGAQKLSDGGDGGIFGWDLPDQTSGQAQWQVIIDAARWLASVKGNEFPIAFRVGIAAGPVRGEMRGGDFSFMGDALNIASRLESMSEPGAPLIDRSVASHLSTAELSTVTKVAELKGITYQGTALKKVA